MRDLRLAIRTWSSTPVLTAVAAVSLALGIGANTAIFSLVDSLLLRSLPVKDPERLALMTHGDAGALRGSQSWTLAVWNEIRDRPQLVDSGFAWSWSRFRLTAGGPTAFANGIWASGAMFDTLGVRPRLGRVFTQADDRQNGGTDFRVAVISYSFWQRRFGGAADVIGHELMLDGAPFTIVGVTPPDFFGPDVGLAFDVVVPFAAERLAMGARQPPDPRLRGGVGIMVRLKPEQSIDAASAALLGLQPQIREATLPARSQDRARWLRDPMFFSPAAGGQSSLRLRYQRPLLTILVVVGLVLTIACANIAHLLLARATARHHELSVRTALGASRWQLARQLLAEAAVLAALGAALGLALALWAGPLLVRQLWTPANQVFLELAMDWRVLGFTIAVTVATVLIFGVAPALRASAVTPIEALKDRGAGGAGENRRGTAGGLIAAQVALSVVLVVAAGLFGRTFVSLTTLDRGFDANRVLVVNVSAQGTAVAPAQRLGVYRRMQEAVRGLPGVVDAAMSFVTPVSGANIRNAVEVSGGVPLPESERVCAMNFISPGWFATFGTPILAGRDVNDRDRQGAPRVGIVNDAFARQFLQGASPLGHTLTMPLPGGRTHPPIEIVGVAADAVFRSLREPAPPTIYVPLAQEDDPLGPAFSETMSISIRSRNRSPAQLTKSVASALEAVDPQFALTFVPLTDQVNASLAQERLVALLSTFFGGVALLLAGLGLYGVTSYATSRRRNEIGIRMALGAESADVVRLIFARMWSSIAVGLFAGIGISLWASRFVATLLYGITPRDPLTLVMSAVVLAAVGSFAAWLPAYRAAAVDPAEALRQN